MRYTSAAFSAMAVAAGLFLTRGEAHADTKQACVAAYDQTQVLRDAGKLVEARKNALACTVPECPGPVVKECTQWLAQIDASLPTVVFEVWDGTGAETGAVQVSLDGEPWLAELDGRAKAIDPGLHVFRYTIAAEEAREERVQIREGEKNRKLVVSFKKEASKPPTFPVAPGPVAAASGPTAVPVPAPSAPSAAPWIVGGLGAAGLLVGAVLGVVTVHDYTVVTDPSQCSATLRMCTTTGKNAEDQGKVLGPATTVALVAGGAGVAAAGIWLGVRRREKKPEAGISLVVRPTAGGAALGVGGRW